MSETKIQHQLKNYILAEGSTHIQRWFLEKLIHKDLATAKKIVEDEIQNGFIVSYHNRGNEYITLKKVQDTEIHIAKLLCDIKHNCIKRTIPVSKIKETVEAIAKEKGITLAPEQKWACINAVNAPVYILTGVPGAGKTTVLDIIKEAMIRLAIVDEFTCLAPTGKASMRMGESLKQDTHTVTHRYMQNMYIGEGVTIIDEFSMVDIFQFEKILEKIMWGTRLILVGDMYQLASVDVGNCLQNLVDSKAFQTGRLDKCFRVDKNALNIIGNVAKIREGSVDFTEGDDFELHKVKRGTSEETILKKIRESYKAEVEKWGAENVCILLPFRKAGKINSDVINQQIREELFEADAPKFCTDLRVMHTKNSTVAFNGEVGTIIKGSNHGEVVVDYGNKIVEYSQEEAEEYLTVAYSMSVHKAQGSEYLCVIMVCLQEHENTCNKNLIYTGVTRAKKKVVMFYDKKTVLNCLTKESSKLRVSCLDMILQDKEKTYPKPNIKRLYIA